MDFYLNHPSISSFRDITKETSKNIEGKTGCFEINEN